MMGFRKIFDEYQSIRHFWQKKVHEGDGEIYQSIGEKIVVQEPHAKTERRPTRKRKSSHVMSDGSLARSGQCFEILHATSYNRRSFEEADRFIHHGDNDSQYQEKLPRSGQLFQSEDEL